MTTRRTSLALGRVTLVLALALSGCAGQKVYEDPVPVMLNRQADIEDRRSAMMQAAERFADDPRRIKNLYRLVWQPGQPSTLRVLAVDQLVEHDEKAFREAVAENIHKVRDWPTMHRIFDLGVERRWPGFAAVLVRSWSRPAHGMTDDDRAERKALQKMYPDRPVVSVVFDVFAREDESISIHEQVGAWELLNRITDTPALMKMLADAPDATPLVVDLKACAEQLHVLPTNNEGVRWLFYLRDPARKPFWDQAAQRAGQLTEAQRRGLELRHLPVLTRLDTDVLAMDRAALLARVKQRIAGAELHLEGPTFDGPMQDHPQQLHVSADRLTWGDLATIDLLLNLQDDRAAVASLFKQADADVRDTSTEYGGVLDYAPATKKFTATLYKPLTRVHDLKFIPRPEMIDAMYTRVAHYHFHAQKHKNSHYAGPGLGDLKMADRLRPNGLVVTCIDRDRLNIDYYQPGFIVVDLGTVRR